MDHRQVVWTGGRGVTLKQVARAVGVSESLASCVLNGAKTGTRVSAATRAAVIAAAKEMGYRRNAHAMSLNTGRSQRIGVYSGRAVLDARNLFFAELLGGIFEGAREYELNTVVHTSGVGADRIRDLVSDRAVDGLVIIAANNDPIVSFLDERQVPAVAMVDRIEALPSVCIDDAAGGRLQAEHLYELGHKRVLYSLPDVPPPSALARYQGFCHRANEIGIEIVTQSDLLVYERAPAHLQFEPLLRGRTPISAVVGWNDASAERLWRELLAIGIDVPGEVSVVGFDGFYPQSIRNEVLTSIKAPWAEVGRQATKALAAMVEGKPIPLTTTLDVSLIKGTTSTFCRTRVGSQ